MSLKHSLLFLIREARENPSGSVSRACTLSVRAWEWYCQAVCRMWCCASRASECVTNESIVSESTSNHELHEKTRLPADRPPLILIQREDGGYGYMTNERERADVHEWYVQHPRQRGGDTAT